MPTSWARRIRNELLELPNPNNAVAKRKAERLNYAMYSELNTRPRTTYLAELRNPNHDLKEGTSV